LKAVSLLSKSFCLFRVIWFHLLFPSTGVDCQWRRLHAHLQSRIESDLFFLLIKIFTNSCLFCNAKQLLNFLSVPYWLLFLNLFKAQDMFCFVYFSFVLLLSSSICLNKIEKNNHSNFVTHQALYLKAAKSFP
jgi:hypothetical protein